MQISPYSLEANVLSTIAEKPPAILADLHIAMRSRIGFLSVEQFVQRTIKPLEVAGYIESTNLGLRLTEAGSEKLETLSVQSRQSEVKWRPQGAEYLGHELGKTCMRPGAYDFLKAPSRIGSTLVPHKGQK